MLTRKTQEKINEYFACSVYGMSNDDLTASRYLGRNGIHQNGGGIGRRTARHVEPHTFQRDDPLSRHHTVFRGKNIAVLYLCLMEGADVLGSFLQDTDENRVGSSKSLVNLLLRYDKG